MESCGIVHLTTRMSLDFSDNNNLAARSNSSALVDLTHLPNNIPVVLVSASPLIFGFSLEVFGLDILLMVLACTLFFGAGTAIYCFYSYYLDLLFIKFCH